MKRLSKVKYFLFIIVITAMSIGCATEKGNTDQKTPGVFGPAPGDTPIELLPDLIADNRLIHRGVVSPDLNEYYYAVSNYDFSQFDIYVIICKDGKWSAPRKASFNSTYDDHGMSFSPDGQTMYFSSTRPVGMDGVADTWHIWKTQSSADAWATPEYVDIPNLRDKLTSHPSVAESGRMYFHASNVDYSDMDIYIADFIDGRYGAGRKLGLDPGKSSGRCTPYVSAEEDYLIYAEIGEPLKLHIAYSSDDGHWSLLKELPDVINIRGQGNPYIFDGGRRLLFAGERRNGEEGWSVSQVSTSSFLEIQ